jgi:hypothetical protein
MMHSEKRRAIISHFSNAKTTLHFIDLDLDNKVLKEFKIEEDIEHWKWVDDKILGIVGSKHIYHLNTHTGMNNNLFRRVATF